DARANGKPADPSADANQDTSTQNSVATLRSMLSTAEFWNEENAGAEAAPEPPAAESELEALRRENGDLRAEVEDLQRRLETGGGGGGGGGGARRGRGGGGGGGGGRPGGGGGAGGEQQRGGGKGESPPPAHKKTQNLRAKPRAPPPLAPKESELIALSDELER